MRVWVDGRIASARPTSLPAVDGPLVGVVLTLVLIGTVMVYSASISLADSPRYNVAPTHFLMRHLLSLGIAFCAAAIAFQIPIGVWQRLAPFVFVGALALLVVVLIPGVGKGVNGAKRWIPLGDFESAAVGADEGRVRAVRGQLHGAQAGLHESLRQRVPCRWHS